MLLKLIAHFSPTDVCVLVECLYECVLIGEIDAVSLWQLFFVFKRSEFSVLLGSPGWSLKRRSRRPRCRSLRCCRQRRAPRTGRYGRSRRCRWTCRSEWRISVSPPALVCTSTWAASAGRNMCRTLAGSGQGGCTYPAPRDREEEVIRYLDQVKIYATRYHKIL